MDMVDPHVHVDALNSYALELMAVAGVKIIISMVSVPEVQENITSDAIFQHCDRVMSFHAWRTSKYFLIDTYLCPAISMVGVPIDYKDGIDKLRFYLNQHHEKIVGIGEIGLHPDSETCPDLRIQEEILRAQLEIAREFEKPADLHTPPTEKPKWVERYLKMIKELKLDPSKVVIDHADGTVTNMITASGCNAAITVQPWRKVRAIDAAQAIQTGDIDRILVDSDCSLLDSDPLAVPKTALEMRKLGMLETDIKKVVWDNPRRVYQLP